MARTQRIALTEGFDTYTVIGADYLPIGPAEEFLQFLRDDEASPNTVKAYAAGLAAWWTVLEHTNTDWREITTSLFGQFLAYLRTGDLPGTTRIGEPEIWLGPASTQLRAAAVLACYRYHADAHGLTGPYQRLFTSRAKRHRSRYIPMLAGVGPPRTKDRPIYTVRRGNLAATPVLLPTQVARILDGCATQTGQRWSGPPSGLWDRLLFATLAEKGCGSGRLCRCATTIFTSAPGPPPTSTSPPARTTPAGPAAKPCARAGSTSATIWKRCIRPTCGIWSTTAPIWQSRIWTRISCSSTSPPGSASRRCDPKPSTPKSIP